MQKFLILIIALVLTSCNVIETWFVTDSPVIEPIAIANQKGFAGNATIEKFVLSTFEYDDPTNPLWWTGNIGIQQVGILGGNYSLFVNGVDAGVYGYIDTTLPNQNYVIQYSASTGYGSHEANQYGIIFDYQDSSNYGLFFVNGYGEYGVGYFEDVTWYPLETGQLSNVNLLNRPFTLSIIIAGKVIRPALNDIEITSILYPKEVSGHSGIYLGSRGSNNASLLVSEFAIKADSD